VMSLLSVPVLSNMPVTTLLLRTTLPGMITFLYDSIGIGVLGCVSCVGGSVSGVSVGVFMVISGSGFSSCLWFLA